MENVISFTKVVKEEICSSSERSLPFLRALLASYIRINGTLLFRDKHTILKLNTENAKIAKFIYQTINSIYNADAHLTFTSGFKNKRAYTIMIETCSEDILDDLDISFLEGKISKNIVKNDETIAGYLAGAFLASGSVNSPKTPNYHLEVALNSENYAKWLSKLFGKYKNSDIEPKTSPRRDKFIVYFKKSDQIANFLIMIGAVNACMEFENVRVDRDFTNMANRLTNIDTANMKKVYDTANKQIEQIKLIDQKLGIDNINNEKQRLLCHLRLENDSMTLQELASLMSEKLKKDITKSNINHLFRSINDLYERLK